MSRKGREVAEGVVTNVREYRLEKPLGRSAHMFVGQFDAQDLPLDLASRRRFNQSGWLFQTLVDPGWPTAASHQIELLVESLRPLTEKEVGQARVFLRFTSHLLHEVVREPEEARR